MANLNRQQRRMQERNQIREWKNKSEYERIISLQKNGITQADLDKAYNNGYENGYMFAAEGFMKKMYAAIAKELIAAGNDRDDVVSFVVGVDHRFAVMFDSDDEIDDVYNKIGVRFNVDRYALNRLEEV